MVIPTPQQGTFPPSGPTTIIATTPSYLYQQYADDSDLQAFVSSYNALAQVYVTWFATIALTVYTGANISGALLDWIAQGVYGFVRPILSSGRFFARGPYNTFAYNTWPLDRIRIIGPKNVAVVTDDIFKRCMTWNFYKGDGTRFNIRWLKRRIKRFLIGQNGTAPNVDNTYEISVSVATTGLVSIRISAGTRTVLGGPIYNRLTFGSRDARFNTIRTRFTSGPNPLPNESVLQQAILSGVLQFPFQFTPLVSIPQGAS